MPKTITVRYKDSNPAWPGDVSASNGYNAAAIGFHGPKYPGYQEDIPGDFFDDDNKDVEYKNRDGSFDMITEMERRRRMYEMGGWHRQPGQKINQPAPPHIPQNKTMLKLYLKPRILEGQELANFMWKTKVATLLFREFSPKSMEFIGEMPAEAIAILKRKAKETGPKESKIYINLASGPAQVEKQIKDQPASKPEESQHPDITIMDAPNAVKYIEQCNDAELLKDYSAKESKMSRPRVAVAIEQRLTQLNSQGAI